MLRVITLQPDPDTGVFDDAELHEFSRTYHVVNWKQDFYMVHGLPQMVVFVEYRERKPERNRFFEKRQSRRGKREPVQLSTSEQNLLQALHKWRSDTAEQAGVPPMGVLHNKHLEQIVKLRPKSKSDLRKISGIGEIKANRYAADILALIHQTPVEEAKRVQERGLTQDEAKKLSNHFENPKDSDKEVSS